MQLSQQVNMKWRCCFCMQLFIIVAASFSSKENENGNEGDRMALLALRDGFIAGGTPPPDGTALSSWNSSLHFCKWQGVTCGKRPRRVTAIELVEQKLDGILSPAIGNLTCLRILFLPNNSLHGQIPKEIGQLWRLQTLSLERNSFQGGIPFEFSNCSDLLVVGLSHNNLTGPIPFQFGSLWKITTFFVQDNHLVGEMPSVFRNMSSLRRLDIGSNNFHGEIGDSLRGLSKLVKLLLWSNNFSGAITPLYNLSSLKELDVSTNLFTGALARDMGVAFPKLTFLSLYKNNFSGTIPSSLSNSSELAFIQLRNNKFSGRVPNNLGKLKSLIHLHLANNNLGSEKSDDLSFIDSLTNCTKLKRLPLNGNMFGGLLPDSIANLTSALEVFSIYENFITGAIPEGIGELSSLTFFDLGGNLFTGTIPKSIGKLVKVSKLYLNGNDLRGEIPSSIGSLTNLLHLDLSRNSLDGIIPAALWNCQGMNTIDISRNHLGGTLSDDVFTRFRGLVHCDLSHNSFNGIFPSAFGKLINLNYLYASYNNFSGEIPTRLGESLGLEYLDLAGNYFKGSIPPSLGSLKGLKWLDLSNNNLSGEIPKELINIRGLQYLNLSFNHLQGAVPLFKNATGVSVAGNTQLCGGNSKLQLQPCKHHQREGKKIPRKVVIAIIITLSVSAFISLFVILFMFFSCRRRKHRKDNPDDLSEGYQRVTYAQLFKATEGFAESNLIGTGSYGNVYKGILNGDERKPVAVKVLNLSKHGATKSFKAECKVLRRIRHRNLLRIITSCSSLDHKGSDFKALVFDFMSNGNLDNWLHFSDMQQQGDTRVVLTLGKRLEIAIDVGCALDYLHNGCETSIVHCDLKPSNILLDKDMIAHVGDFGLAKLVHGVTENFSGGESLSTTTFKGTIGYVAPEYGMGAPISPRGDIYSYGILLLEMIAGKRPTDDIFNNEMSLRSYIERATADHIEEVVDECLMNELHEATATLRNPEQIELQWHTFLVSFVEVGILCSAESYKDRMDIQSAIKCLKGIKEKYGSLITRLQRDVY